MIFFLIQYKFCNGLTETTSNYLKTQIISIYLPRPKITIKSGIYLVIHKVCGFPPRKLQQRIRLYFYHFHWKITSLHNLNYFQTI